ncbi:putative phosphatidylglycerol specific phospholipase C [Mycena rosella]|uniref:Phosphatidylglycerol specific phospholipase C n=1 Tax=Mycena rosella TaxID=1033263 RepID=A0AAD7G9V7_MYCRO|nr:putative phosphatidylglycerol specific phospholipase C [Mycena rosella]
MKANTTAAFLGLLATSTSIVSNTVEAIFGRTNTTVSPPPFGYTAGSPESIANLKDKIKHVVWVLLENRSFDNILGGVNRPGSTIRQQRGCVHPRERNRPSVTQCTRSKDFDSVLQDPDHSVTGNNFEFYSTFVPTDAAIQNGSLTATNQGFIQQQMLVWGPLGGENNTVALSAAQVMGYYDEAEPTNPNRACALSGTSDGHGTNDNDFETASIDVNSIFETASAHDISWLNYDGTNGAFAPDALFYTWTAANAPGNLSYLNPSCCDGNTNSMHPTGNVSYGQVFVKQIYDAVRQGPHWNDTLLVLTYDESGGFHDHVPSPIAVRPDNKTYSETALDGETYTFLFDRLGGRMPTWLISAFTPAGFIENLGTNPATGKPEAYSATSVLKTLGLLWDFADFTPRVSNSPSFDHLVGPKMRMDAPLVLTPPSPFPFAT